jgi:hypothetical protein
MCDDIDCILHSKVIFTGLQWDSNLDTTSYIAEESEFESIFFIALSKIPIQAKVEISKKLARIESCDFRFSKGPVDFRGKQRVLPPYAPTMLGLADEENNNCVVYINLRQPKQNLENVIGHELAHVFLNHPIDYPHLSPLEEDDVKQFEENEIAARRQAEIEWHFGGFE